MPPDRGTSNKTQKTDVKKESKSSTPRKERRTGDVSNAIPSKSKQVTKVTSETSLSRQRTKVKKEDNVTSPAEKVSKSSRIDAAKLKDVKKDLERDLKKVKETLARNRTVKNSPYKPTASRPSLLERTASEELSTSRLSNASIRSKNTPSSQSSSREVKKVPSKAKTSDLPKQVDSRSRSRPGRSIQRDDGASNRNKERQLSRDRQPAKLSRERTRTRTLSPHEVKVARGIPPLESQRSSKSSKQTNETIAVVPSTSASTNVNETSHDKDSSVVQKLDNDDYEDDFEDYESDFEEDVPGSSAESSSISNVASESETSSADESNGSEDEVVELLNRPVVEEEKKLDSGNYDLTDNKRKGKEIQQIKDALEKENSGVPAQGVVRKNSLLRHPTVARDEGFEEEKTYDSKSFSDKKNAAFINFASAKKKMEEQKVTAKARKRGEELLGMIRLDTVNFSLLDLPPVPYEVYIKSYGRSNTQQASVQTNEDDLSEEVQTEEILTKNKWTQNPVAYHPIVKEENGEVSPLLFAQEHLGCGGDSEQDPELWKRLIGYDSVRLNKFLLNAGQAILQHLDQQSLKQESRLSQSSAASYCSAGFFTLGVNSVPFLTGRSVSILCFSELHPTTLLTVHSEPSSSLEAVDAFLGRCMLCVWNILKPVTPEKILVCSNNVTSVSFHRDEDNLVFGGLCEGTICVWDLKEPAAVHCQGDRHAPDWVIRSPTYSTAEILKNEGHLTEVTAVCAVGSIDQESTKKSKHSPIQVCSVEVAGVAIVWTVVRTVGNSLQSGLAQEDLGLAYWGRVRLVQSIIINLFEGLNLWTLSCYMYRKYG